MRAATELPGPAQVGTRQLLAAEELWVHTEVGETAVVASAFVKVVGMASAVRYLSLSAVVGEPAEAASAFAKVVGMASAVRYLSLSAVVGDPAETLLVRELVAASPALV